MRTPQKTLALWLFLFVIMILVYKAYDNKATQGINDFNYSKFRVALEAGEIETVTFRQDSSEIIGTVKPEFKEKYGGDKFTIVGNTGDEGYKLVLSNE
jgi:cell division protease FtsH